MKIAVGGAKLTSGVRWLGIGDDPKEPDDLERLIAEKLRGAGIIQQPSPSKSEKKEGERPLDADAAFLKYRFGGQLRNYRRWGAPYTFAFIVLSLGVIVTGLATSGIAAGWNEAEWARWSILSLGIVTGAVTAINQMWRPGQKGVSRTKGANLLCREGWSFVHDRGRYKDINDVRQAWALFVDEVESIRTMVAAVDEAEPSPLATPEPGNKKGVSSAPASQGSAPSSGVAPARWVTASEAVTSKASRRRPWRRR